ncbi:PIN domain containing protein [Halapricum desulfuricans]|uniref:PIN domain containing protein n=1 Tax=Halapricum desulfuricans TaxID=2841257 RepID=A0A897NHL6_9EURY|nr:PIN domain containing protein [Halapricum desulfuricans]
MPSVVLDVQKVNPYRWVRRGSRRSDVVSARIADSKTRELIVTLDLLTRAFVSGRIETFDTL